ncbi:cryptochrome [Clavulina sp. PMI_390]|nr:cryptochrome [Clavulina sp. PMI_390]
MPQKNIVIALFRNDLRVHDNPILQHRRPSASNDAPTHLLPVYVFDEAIFDLTGLEEPTRPGAKDSPVTVPRTALLGLRKTDLFRTRFILESVYDLRTQLLNRRSNLLITAGQPHVILDRLIQKLHENGDVVNSVWMTKEYASEELRTESRIARVVSRASSSDSAGGLGAELRFVHSRPMVHPEDLPFAPSECPDQFTSFRKVVEGLGQEQMVRPCAADEELLPFPSDSVDDLIHHLSAEPFGSYESASKHILAPFHSSSTGDGAEQDESRAAPATIFRGGESVALQRLSHYVSGASAPLSTYKQTRNGLLGDDFSSHLSPWLACGAISPRKIWEAIDDWDRQHTRHGNGTKDSYWLRFELLWRDYFIYIAQKYGDDIFKLGGVQTSLNPSKYEPNKNGGPNATEWKDARAELEKGANGALRKWMDGQTGVPFIDANMIELNTTGYMSNRGRQNVASFLAKDLGIDWRAGAEYFEEKLLDYDPYANYGNWMYVAGVGTDPRDGRQFNPIKQGKDYDPEGIYVKHWIPALSGVPSEHIHHPWLVRNSSKSVDIPRIYQKAPPTERAAWRSQCTRQAGQGSKLSKGNEAERVEKGHRHH